jgi:2,5-diketo-D-gluconate reductase A
MPIPALELNDGTHIPQLGFGVFQVAPETTAATVLGAFEAGYRHIDTAQMYRNEEGVGEALAQSGLARDDVYVTTKLNNGFHRSPDVRPALERSLTLLGLDRVDLFLIHWPLPTRYDGDFVSTWEAMIDLRAAGLTTSIGVSNFQPAHLDRIVAATSVVPAINQIEVHPYFGNESARAANANHGVATEAWSPIAQGAVASDPTIGEIATGLSRTATQVTLRWHLQRGDVVIPKTNTPSRMLENISLFDFELSAADMATISGLDQRESGRIGPNPDTFDWIP